MNIGDLIAKIHLPTLIGSEFGSDAIQGLREERGGVICDPRPAWREENPSFSVYKARSGSWRWKRHGGDEAGGNAYDLLLEVGHTKEQALTKLQRLAGGSLDSRHTGSTLSHSIHTPPTVLDLARGAIARIVPLTPDEQAKSARMLAPLKIQDAAAQDLKARGLLGWDGLQAGKLRGNFQTREGKVLARAGALGFLLIGPDGNLRGLKVRNLGSTSDLAAAGVDRYVYRIAGHGAPAWCSPSYSQDTALLIVEGELNGAAAARALLASGQTLNVQGLAGAGGVPFLDGLPGTVVYLYADPDKAGLTCLARVGELAQAAGADEIRVLAPLDEGDFCDELGRLGAVAFGGWLRTALKAAQPAPDLGPRLELGTPTVPKTILSGTTPSIWGQQRRSRQDIWGHKRGVL
jgi:hypothetical protein